MVPDVFFFPLLILFVGLFVAPSAGSTCALPFLRFGGFCSCGILISGGITLSPSCSSVDGISAMSSFLSTWRQSLLSRVVSFFDWLTSWLRWFLFLPSRYGGALNRAWRRYSMFIFFRFSCFLWGWTCSCTSIPATHSRWFWIPISVRRSRLVTYLPLFVLTLFKGVALVPGLLTVCTLFN